MNQPHTTIGDAELLAAWRGGQAAAGQQLFERHYEVVERFLHNKVDAEQAVDLAQDVFTACLESRDRIRDDTRFRAYLLGIAYRQLCAYLRMRYRNEGRREVTELPIHELGSSPSSRLARAREQRLLLEGLRAIPLKYQAVLELHYWEDLSTNEIAEVLDIPAGTVRSRLLRAREALEAAMAAISRSPELLDSTLTRLDDWAVSCRAELARGHVQPAK